MLKKIVISVLAMMFLAFSGFQCQAEKKMTPGELAQGTVQLLCDNIEILNNQDISNGDITVHFNTAYTIPIHRHGIDSSVLSDPSHLFAVGLLGTNVTITNNSNELRVIDFSNSSIATNDFSTLPFLGGMKYIDQNKKDAIPSKFIQAGQSITLDVYFSCYTMGPHFWIPDYETVPFVNAGNQSQITLFLNVKDPSGVGKYLDFKSPIVGIDVPVFLAKMQKIQDEARAMQAK